MNLGNSERQANPSREVAEQLRPIPKNSVSDEIVNQLIDLISRKVLKPGDRLPSERQLCEKFGVGRTSVREALRSLSVMGILMGRVGDGTFVSENDSYLERTFEWGFALDPKQVEDLIETRLMLESNTALWAAERSTNENLVAIKSALEGMHAEIDRPNEFLEYDINFHLEIARAAQNSILYNLVRTTRHYLQQWIKGSLETASSQAKDRACLSVAQHREIFAALTEKNPNMARECMRSHILSSSKDFQSRLAP